MLNNIEDDYVTSIAMSLYFDNRINKKFRNMENKGGVLNGEFIKNHLKKETELEDKIFELEKKIKSLQNITSNTGDIDDIGHRLLIKIAMRMQIDLPQYGYEGYDIGINDVSNFGLGQLRVDGVYIDEQELTYLKTLVESKSETNIIDNRIASKVLFNYCNASPILVDTDSKVNYNAQTNQYVYAKTW